eukprot:TRINITY_DN32660_c0_g1_i1.p1 TRINITY_DN32660_c0_g1~~TRINITY_DN32660_c0_g1_i1.p1  ORF type:complete len:203 (+),score=78.97 TRINITY_DN32660_c0_g1_i1:46-609(+)
MAADAAGELPPAQPGHGIDGELAYLFVLKEARALDADEFEIAKELALSGEFPSTRVVRLFLLHKGGGLNDVEFAAAKKALFNDTPVPPCDIVERALQQGMAAAAGEEEGMTLDVNFLPSGQRHKLPGVSGDMTVAELKEQLTEAAGSPATHMRIVFAGKELDDEQTLGHYGVIGGDEVSVNCILRLR